MPRRLSEYGFNDFLHLRPLTHGWKRLRYRRIDRRYGALQPRAGDVNAIADAIRGRTVLATVAFEDPQGLELQCALMRRFVSFDHHLVADNSRDAENQARNRGIAASHGALYLQLPDNPWTQRNDSRSQGIALNWLWTNVIRPGEPRAFGFLDDDLYPVEPTDPFAPLQHCTFHGDLRFAEPRWFLWAGFCVFRFDAVSDKPLDFGLDWSLGLDTGGANWNVLYRDFDWRHVPARQVERIAALPDLSLDEAFFERRGDWIHEVGWPRDPTIAARKRVALMRMLAPLVDDAASR